MCLCLQGKKKKRKRAKSETLLDGKTISILITLGFIDNKKDMLLKPVAVN